MKNIIRFVHISDTHFGPAEDFELLGVKPFETSTKLLQAINKLPLTPDFIFHTGDIIHNGNFSAEDNLKAYNLAAKLLTQFRFPLFLIPGNQDAINSKPNLAELFKIKNFEPLLTNSEKFCYRFTKNDTTFLALDGKVDQGFASQGRISEDQLEILAREVSNSKQLVVFIHFVPFIFDCPWAEREMILINGEDFHKTLLKNPKKIRGVFHGHLHLNTQTYVDGILYSGVGSSCVQLDYWPDLQEFATNLRSPLAFNLITIDENKTVIKQYSV